jgi:hypothetical protein
VKEWRTYASADSPAVFGFSLMQYAASYATVELPSPIFEFAKSTLASEELLEHSAAWTSTIRGLPSMPKALNGFNEKTRASHHREAVLLLGCCDRHNISLRKALIEEVGKAIHIASAFHLAVLLYRNVGGQQNVIAHRL